MLAWWSLCIGIGAIAIAQLLRLNQRRRLFTAPPPRNVLIRRPPRADAIVVPAAPPPPLAASPATEPLPATRPADSGTDAGIVYIDAAGHCTLADRGARQILDWSGGQRTLSDVLAGGNQESAALLNQLVQQGAVDVYSTALAGPAPAPVEISAVALRDRDDNLWGAALFIHRSSAAASAACSAAPSPVGADRARG